MYNNYDYLMGADTPDAPWNQEDPPEVEVDVTASHTVSRDTTITTTDYTDTFEDGFECEDLNGDYKSQHKGPIELINILQEELLPEYNKLKEKITFFNHLSRKNMMAEPINGSYINPKIKSAEPTQMEYKRFYYLTDVLEDCKGWVEDESEVVMN